ncbi:GntR family transcriptional regulator [Streptomyces europaeiscabiei]|uniref:GntR family transcriptional regulator n=1 Tax=Streptomyces europaeiscabiei TaxID=146819 RepID=A0AAJ2PTX8_9ACTN|nr:GntR family transcriptional regulator [Streptomyces europaeiscabiei]MDX3133223.1 GntR family transcriptional regulator [Streptomyces europaeiscabiei]
MDHKFEWLEQRTTTPDGVYRTLRAAILDGTVPPGGQLREAHIAADLGISRSPLREALTKLEEEGLVVKIPFRGAFVVEVSARDVAEIASVRLRVEPYAAELSAEALRGPERRQLMQTVEDLHRATEKNDIPAGIDAHLRFHGLFYDLSKHGILQSLWSGWETKLRLYLSVDHRTYSDDPHQLVVEHERLAAVALEGDTDAFRQELAAHFQSALRGQTEDQGESAPRHA